MNHVPFTYLIGWSTHNKFYYGMRTARIPVCFPDSLIDQANQLAAIIDPDTGGANDR